MPLKSYIEIDHIDRIFPLATGGTYTALKNIHLKIEQGEFITLIGHSGCGKSTLLNIVAGLDHPSTGGILLEGRQVTGPGPERMVVFQNYSLLPWLTVRQNIALAVDEVLGSLSDSERQAIVEQHITLVGLTAAADKRPAMLSGGMKQRVAIARALATRPKVLLLDEPFGALDALTRGNLQSQLMQIAQESHVTCVMVTHDVDEALLLSDRIVMLTTGPAAHIGQILSVPFPRPRHRLDVIQHPDYYSLRGEMIYFLNQQKRVKQRHTAVPAAPVVTTGQGLEKTTLELGFIPLTDCAPLIVAQRLGLFAKHGLEQVTLSREPSWKAISDGVTSGRLDGAQMVAGMPLQLTLGGSPVVTALTLSRGGNAITFSRSLFQQGIRTREQFRAYLQHTPDHRHTLAMVHPASMHNLLLRYWLSEGGIHPDRDIHLTTVPPAQMVASLKSGAIDGFCVGDPWNSRAVNEEVGFVITTTPEILPSHLEKVLGVSAEWAQRYPKTHLALVKALLEACHYCDIPHHRTEISEWLCHPDAVGATPAVLRPGFLDPYNNGTGSEPYSLYNFHQFSNGRNSCPEILENLWILTQLARWGICPFPRNWMEVLDQVLLPEVYATAAARLGLPDRAYDRGPLLFGEGAIFDGLHPLEYLQSVAIKGPVEISEWSLDGALAVPV